MKESRNREKERKTQRKGSKFVHFVEKNFSMTKKKVVRIFFRELKGTFKDFFLKIYFQKIFAPPIFMTSLRPCEQQCSRDVLRPRVAFLKGRYINVR